MQLAEKYQPSTIEAFAGVDRPKKILSAFVQKPYESAWLLVGPSGIGKTTLAFAAAGALGARRELGGGIYHVPAKQCNLESIQTISEQCHYKPMSGSPWNVVLIDEGDQMSGAAQLALLSKLDSADPVPDTIWFITANDTSKLEDRFLSRCRKIQFTTDGLLQPAAAMMRKIWKKETKGIDPAPAEPDFEMILQSAKMNVREALGLLEMEILCPGSTFEESPAPTPTASKGSTTGAVYTIGIEGLPPETVQDTAAALGCFTIIDCHPRPQRALRSKLGALYQWAGDKLGPQRVKSDVREGGLNWLTGLVATGKNVLLAYHVMVPGECHRHHTIAKALLQRGIDPVHVFGDQLILASEMQRAIEVGEEPKSRRWTQRVQ